MMSFKARILSVLIGLVILALTSFLVRRRRLYNIYAITWFLISLAFIVMGVANGVIEVAASAMGIYSPATAIVVVAIGSTLAIVLHLSMIVTEQHRQIRNFEKEIALLKRMSR